MTQIQLLILGIFLLSLGAILGYFARQSIAKRKIGSLEEIIHQKLAKAQQEAEGILKEAKTKAEKILQTAQKEEEIKRKELLKAEKLLLERGIKLDRKEELIERKREEILKKANLLERKDQELQQALKETQQKLEKIAGLSKEQAFEILLKKIEQEHEQEIAHKLRQLENEGIERFEKKAKEILATAIQKLAVSQAQELTTTTVTLPDDEIKGRIIGKEGRNIKTLERLTGVEILVDDTPEVVVISGFDPIRRQIAKIALQKLIIDGRIQPARIEEEVAKAEKEIENQIKEAGEAAAFETGIVGLDPRLLKILGRLRFRTSYGQNVLLHSIEVAHLAGTIAAELGANVKVAKMAGLFHDIGKALDHQIEGSHVVIGMKILEKFGIQKEVIDAMKSHHGEFPVENLEAIIVQTADAISGSRPGARKETLEQYLKRIEELEKIALSFSGVEKAWALQAGREIRVFVKANEIDDLGTYKLAKEIAQQIEQELKYPGEIKVTVIREKRVVEFAR